MALLWLPSGREGTASIWCEPRGLCAVKLRHKKRFGGALYKNPASTVLAGSGHHKIMED